MKESRFTRPAARVQANPPFGAVKDGYMPPGTADLRAKPVCSAAATERSSSIRNARRPGEKTDRSMTSLADAIAAVAFPIELHHSGQLKSAPKVGFARLRCW
jgi:hypothetical protein